MVKVIVKKIIADWHIWLVLNIVSQFFRMAIKSVWFNELPQYLTFSCRYSLEGGLFMLIMHRWKFPYSWLVIFILSAPFLDKLDIISITKLGIAILFLGYYFQYIKGDGENAKIKM